MFQSKKINILMLITPIFTAPPSTPKALTSFCMTKAQYFFVSSRWFTCCDVNEVPIKIETIDPASISLAERSDDLHATQEIRDSSYGPFTASVRPRRLMSVELLPEPDATESMPTDALGGTEDSKMLMRKRIAQRHRTVV